MGLNNRKRQKRKHKDDELNRESEKSLGENSDNHTRIQSSIDCLLTSLDGEVGLLVLRRGQRQDDLILDQSLDQRFPGLRPRRRGGFHLFLLSTFNTKSTPINNRIQSNSK